MKALYLTLLLVSAAALAFQITLTRFFSLAQGSHLAFMAISLALLGTGASGTYLFIKQTKRSGQSHTLTRGAFLFTLSVPLSYLATNYSPFDTYRLAWERSQLLWLVLYYLALTVPFFFGGLVIGSALTMPTSRIGPIYAANLIGSGLGLPLALFSLAIVGGPGTVFFCTLLGWLSYVVSVKYQASGSKSQKRNTQHAIRFTLYTLISLLCLYLTFFPPASFSVRLTPYKSLSQALLYPDSEIIFQKWNAFSRVDVLRSEGIRSAPGLSFAYSGQIPPQLGLTVDGDNLSPLTSPTNPGFTQYLPLALGFSLRPQADVLILEPGGGLAVLTALQNEAQTVTVVQSNHTVAEAVGQRFADFDGHLYQNPRVTVVIDEPRRFLYRTDQQFDLIIWPLTDNFHPVTAGAYTLNEDYRYTVEAFADALAHLSPGGLLVAERWLQLPPSESLRLGGSLIEALGQMRDEGERAKKEDFKPDAQLLAIRSLQTSLIAVSPSPLASEDLATVRRFVAEYQFDLVWLPDIQPEETNRYSVVPDNIYYQTFADLLAAPDPATFYAVYPYAVTPPTDDHPYFFHFFKWQQIPEILQTLGKTWEPFGGSGYLVLVVLLILVVILSAGLILLPLLWLKKDEGERRKDEIPHSLLPTPYFLLYFALLGLGFLFIEIPLLQRFILYLGQPAYAFAGVVSALLVASGVGSGYLSGRMSLRVALPLIAIVAIVYPFLLPYLFETTLQFSFAGRMGITAVALFPLGLLLGIPFPGGLELIKKATPRLIPWVWAVNGCASVVSAVLAAMIALTWGFSVVLWSAAGAYTLAGIIVYSLRVNGTNRTPPQLVRKISSPFRSINHKL
ncbi:MAG: hypothetical protein JXM69_21750 [Anaerolineae bacterium]|nr:hypothetical protein [Anaerolineae bacterium]